MPSDPQAPTRPGIRVGAANEFTLFFHVLPGHGPAIREAIEDLQATPGYRPGDYDVPISSIHEARFVVFDNDTRLLFATSFDGSWDAYMDDFSMSPLAGFDSIFRHTEGYEGLPDIAAIKAFVLGAQETASGYSRNYPGSVKELRKAMRVNASIEPGAVCQGGITATGTTPREVQTQQ